MGQCLLTGHRDRSVQQCRGADGGVVDDAVQHHLRGFRLDRDRIGGDLGDLGGQVFTPREIVGAAPRANRMHQHSQHPMQRRLGCDIDLCNRLATPQLRDDPKRQSARAFHSAQAPGVRDGPAARRLGN